MFALKSRLRLLKTHISVPPLSSAVRNQPFSMAVSFQLQGEVFSALTTSSNSQVQGNRLRTGRISPESSKEEPPSSAILSRKSLEQNSLQRRADTISMSHTLAPGVSTLHWWLRRHLLTWKVSPPSPHRSQAQRSWGHYPVYLSPLGNVRER